MEQHEEKNARVQLEFVDRTLPLESAAEFTLPDYRSEISRLLWVRPTLLPPERFIGGGKADFSGVIRFELLYVGPDGALYGAEQENGYSFSLPLEALSAYDTAAGIALCAEPVIDSVISRVTGPRKLSVRCKMHARVRGYAEKNLAVRCKEKETLGEELCCLYELAETGRMHFGFKENICLSDSFESEGEVRVIGTHGSVFLSEVTALKEEILCRGELLLTLLLCREEEEGALPYTVCRRIPFEQALSAQEIGPHCSASATATVGEIHVNIEEGRVYTEAQCTLCASATEELPSLICRDLFLPGSVADCHFSEETLWRPTVCCNRNFSVSGERALSELGLGNDTEIIDVSAEAEIREKSADGNKLALGGELCCHVLCRRAGEFSVVDVSYPIRLLLEEGDANMYTDCRVSSCRVNILHDALRADAELQLALCGKSCTVTRVLTEASFTPAKQGSKESGPEIYYPASGETLWDVAKRYSLSPEALGAANGIVAESPAEKDSLLGKKFLLIP